MAAVKTASPSTGKLGGSSPATAGPLRQTVLRRITVGDDRDARKIQNTERYKRGVSVSSEYSPSVTSGAASTARAKSEYCEGNLLTELVIDTPSDIMCVRFNPAGSIVAAGLTDGSIQIYDAETGDVLQSLVVDEGSQSRLPVTSVQFLPARDFESAAGRSRALVATYTTGHVRFWHYASGKCTSTINELRTSAQTMSSVFNPLGDRFVTVGADPQIYLYDVATRKRINTLEATDSRYKMDGHRYRVFAVQYNPSEPNVFLTGGWDNTVQFWDDRVKHSFRRLYGPHICGDALDIDPIQGHILTGSWRKDTPLQVWDFASGEKIKDVPDDLLNTSLLYSAQWLGKENIVCGGSSKNLARIIDRGTLNTVGQLVELPQGVYSIDNDHMGVKPRLAVAAGKKIYLIRSPVIQATK